MLIRKLFELAYTGGSGVVDFYELIQVSAVVSTLVVANREAGAGSVSLSHAILGDADDPAQYFMVEEPITAKATPGCRLKEFGITLSQGDVLRVDSDVDLAITGWGRGAAIVSDWRFLLGNVLEVAAVPPEAGDDNDEDPLAPLARVANGEAELFGRFEHDRGGVYVLNLDLNSIKYASPDVDAPNGFRDLLYHLNYTPGLPENDVALAGDVFSMFRPSFQDWTVYAGQTWKITATSVAADIFDGSAHVKLYCRETGHYYNGGANAWDSSAADLLTVADGASSALSETIPPDPALKGRGTYRLIFAFDPDEFGTYNTVQKITVTAPLAYPEIDAAAVIGHNIPDGATVVLELSGGPSWDLLPAFPSFVALDQDAGLGREWVLTITMPDGLTSPAPYIGELHLGLSRETLSCPILPLDIRYDAPTQFRVERASGAMAVTADDVPPLAKLLLKFGKLGGSQAQVEQARELIYKGTREGVDPIIIVGSPNDVVPILMGRIEKTIGFSRVGFDSQTFDLTVNEQPLPKLL